MKKTIVLSIASVLSLTLYAQNPVKVNQVGYSTLGEKIAVMEPQVKSTVYSLKDSRGKTVWKGKAIRKVKSPFSEKVRSIVDFSTVEKEGVYTLVAGKYRQKVVVAQHPYAEAAKASLKAFYLLRTATDIEPCYAGEYARRAAHADTVVYVHPSAVSPGRPAETVISSPLGWYDAGDFNKYIVNSAFAVGVMLQAYQANPDFFNSLNVNIPESEDNVPDILDEAMYNLLWMITMQDPYDGGVYHKLTTPSFEGFIMPSEARQKRYVVQKSTQAALDFAAVMALAYRVYSAFPKYTNFCKKALSAAERAYAWAVKNPAVLYDQPGNNAKYSPEVSTGMYDDKYVADEFFWASTELFLSTRQNGYLMQARQFMPEKYTIPVWGDVAGLGIMQWYNQEICGSADAKAVDLTNVRVSMKTLCDGAVDSLPLSSLCSVFGNDAAEFIWGSNAEMCAGKGITLMYQYALTGKEEYRRAAETTIHYLFGRNATGYCFLTGFGTQRVKNPHQRISAADGIEDPLPGFLVGGPNAGRQDAAELPEYPSESPDEAYQDHVGSYASNEIAINWNAYLIALLSWVK